MHFRWCYSQFITHRMSADLGATVEEALMAVCVPFSVNVTLRVRDGAHSVTIKVCCSVLYSFTLEIIGDGGAPGCRGADRKHLPCTQCHFPHSQPTGACVHVLLAVAYLSLLCCCVVALLRCTNSTRLTVKAWISAKVVMTH